VETSKLDVNQVVADVTGMLRRLIGEDIAMQMRASPDTPAVVANHGQMEQALTNLVINARDAMPLGGTLTIETRCIRAHEIPSAVAGSRDRGVVPATYAGIIVRDTGHGMAESVRARVFEPFFTTKAPGKGTGLGLATVYGIVKGAGGVIDVSSTVGEGSTFTIYLPGIR
jgi:two-component system cell cycle sensor histidine kinase/response regulator CckA